MKCELFPFQQKALDSLHKCCAIAQQNYGAMRVPQVISFTAPTGAGKTIISSALIEQIFCGSPNVPEQPNAIVVWLSDSPELNKQSRDKIETKADRIQIGQCVTIEDESFDQEILEDGYIYFLNTQKLSKTSNLTSHSDSRQYTIWETLNNTILQKSDHLYMIIDEAHRGAKTNQTSIMQSFIKGNEYCPPMPVVVGMSATIERFNALIAGTTSSQHFVRITPEEVRQSGLLKDLIKIFSPDDSLENKEMGVLQAATDEWEDKWAHWHQYCKEQHYKYVNPIFVIQVENGKGEQISATDLDECLSVIEKRRNSKFAEGEVVHCFGNHTDITINGLTIRYVEPSRIQDDDNIKVVFFKESLTTGWDCPRAETMMSFQHAVDSTYIAQLLGRMIRTPMQMHIQVDESLNFVHLYLPHFKADTVSAIVDELQKGEGGIIPTSQDNVGGKRKTTRLSIKQNNTSETGQNTDNGQGQNSGDSQEQSADTTQKQDSEGNKEQPAEPNTGQKSEISQEQSSESSQKEETQDGQEQSSESNQEHNSENNSNQDSQPSSDTTATPSSSTNDDTTGKVTNNQEISNDSSFDQMEIMRQINSLGLVSYKIRETQINDYAESLFKLAHLLTQSGLWHDAIKTILKEVVSKIADYISVLKKDGVYDSMAEKVLEIKLTKKVFDTLGNAVDDDNQLSFFTSSNADLERQFRQANILLYNEGIGETYGQLHSDKNDDDAYKIQFILYAGNDDCITELKNYAETRFHGLVDQYRIAINKLDDKYKRQYDTIVSNGDVISKHTFNLPENFEITFDENYTKCTDHLFLDDFGFAYFKLNKWESTTLNEERHREGFVCWLRNQDRKSWALCIPYKINGKHKAMYPDFLIFSKTEDGGYHISILEPHGDQYADALPKAQGMAEYAKQNATTLDSIQIIRIFDDYTTGKQHCRRLDLSKSAIQKKIMNLSTPDDLNNLFITDGFVEYNLSDKCE